MSKYKIIITLILFCFFQTTPSISFEIKIPKKLGDLKKITEDIKKELEKKEPEVKKEEVKKEEVKKEEIKGVSIGSLVNKRVEFRFKGVSKNDYDDDEYCKWSVIYYFYSDNYFEAFHGCTEFFAKSWSQVQETATTTFGTWKILDENGLDIITTTKWANQIRETNINIDLKKLTGDVDGGAVGTPRFQNVGWDVKISDITPYNNYEYALKTELKEIGLDRIDEGVFLNKSVEIKYTGSGACKDYKMIYNFYDDFTYRQKDYCAGEIEYTSKLFKWKFSEPDTYANFLDYTIIINYKDKHGDEFYDSFSLNLKHPEATYNYRPNRGDGNQTETWIVGDIKDIDKNDSETEIVKSAPNCKEIIAKSESDQKSKTLGGYKDFYFGMSVKDADQFLDCKGELDPKINITNIKGWRIDGLYKYNTTLNFKEEKISKVTVQLFVNMRDKTPYFGASEIEEFKEIKKLLSDKYKLVRKPTKVSIDEYNSTKYGDLVWILESNIDGNLILLNLGQSPGKTKYFYHGYINYLSSEESKIYKKELDSKVVKSDDL